MKRLALVFFLCATSALAQDRNHGTNGEALRMQSFLDRVDRLCRTAPANKCVDAGLRFAAAHPGDGLSLSDLSRLRERLGAWYRWRQDSLALQARLSFGAGLLLADGVGMPALHKAFDTDGNGKVSKTELLADVKMDKRPLGRVLADPKAVDRTRLARRLNLPPSLVNGLFTATAR